MLIALFKMDFHSFYYFFLSLGFFFLSFHFSISFDSLDFSFVCNMDFLFGFSRSHSSTLSFLLSLSLFHSLSLDSTHCRTNDTRKKRAQRSWSFNAFLTFIRLICNREIIRYDIVFIISTAITATYIHTYI